MGQQFNVVPRLFCENTVCSVDCYSFPKSDKYCTRNTCSCSCRFLHTCKVYKENIVQIKTFTKLSPTPKNWTIHLKITVADTGII